MAEHKKIVVPKSNNALQRCNAKSQYEESPEHSRAMVRGAAAAFFAAFSTSA